MGYEAQILHSTALAPDAALKDFQKLLRECSERENLLLVGHNPNLATFLGSLLVPNSNPEARIRLRKGSLARVVLTRGPAILQGLLDPRTVRATWIVQVPMALFRTGLLMNLVNRGSDFRTLKYSRSATSTTEVGQDKDEFSNLPSALIKVRAAM